MSKPSLSHGLTFPDDYSSHRKWLNISCRYHGYSPAMIEKFCAMGFDVHAVVGAFEHVGIPTNNGAYYDLEEEYNGDVTAWLFGEA